MSMRNLPAWDLPLSQTLAPAGARLTTLREAGRFLSEHFGSVTHSAVLERAIELLMRAAETGRPADRRAATEQLVRVLDWRGLL